jgi:flagellar hook-associated protein 1 FlgK
MPGISSLEIGKRALIAQKIGLDVTSNNIANVNTPGYSRRTAVFTESDPLNSNGNYFGTGVIVDKLQSFREEYYDKEIRNSSSRYNLYLTDSQYYQKIETIISEPGDNGIGELVDGFLNKFDELALSPESEALRQSVISTGQTLTDRVNQTANDLSDLRNDTKKSAAQAVTEINGLLKDIATLNTNLLQSKASDNGEFQTYIDQRANKFEELSKYIDITVGKNDDGSANIFVNGTNILTSGVYSEVKLNESVNSVTKEKNLALVKYDKEKNTSLELQVQSGEMSSYLKTYNVSLDNFDTSGGFSITKNLNQYVITLATKINQLTQQGFGLNNGTGTGGTGTSTGTGGTGTSTGTGGTGSTNTSAINLTKLSNGSITASNIKVTELLAGNSTDLPISSVLNEPGNSTIARNIARIAQNPGFLNNQTPSEYYTTFLGKIGTLSKEAANGTQISKLMSDQLSSQRESIIGVNLDEEAVNLIKYQKAFEAASRIVTMTNDMMTTIINLGR